MMDHKTRKKHPERPQRIKAIIELLQARFFLTHPRVFFMSKIERHAND
jgi:hypothetical protein